MIEVEKVKESVYRFKKILIRFGNQLAFINCSINTPAGYSINQYTPHSLLIMPIYYDYKSLHFFLTKFMIEYANYYWN